MEKEFIPYKQALALKELGFNEPCVAIFNINNELNIDDGFYKQEEYHKDTVLAPTFSQVFRWFREKYNLQQYIYPTVLKNDENNTYFSDYCWNIFGTNIPFKKTNDLDVNNVGYEEAELECLKKLIEIVKNK